MWRVIYEDLSEFTSDQHAWSDLPADGVQGLVEYITRSIRDPDAPVGEVEIIEGEEIEINPPMIDIVVPTPRLGYDRYFLATDIDSSEILGFTRDSETDIKLRYPDAQIIRGKTTSTTRFWEIEKMLGLRKNDNMGSDWRKNVVGWRIWYADKKVFDSKTTAWVDLPKDGVQIIKLYENWKYAGGLFRFRQTLAIRDFYFEAPGPENRPIYDASDESEAEIKQRYPGAVILRGSFINEMRLRKIIDQANNSRQF